MECCKCKEYGWSAPQQGVWENPATRNWYCNFHADSMHKTISAQQLENEFFKILDSYISNCEAECSFGGTVFNFKLVLSDKYRKSLLPGLDFTGATFEHGANFSHVIFGGAVDLSETTFSETLTVISSEFQAEANFECAEFKDHVKLTNCSFKNGVSFKKISASRKFSLYKSVFASNIDAANARISGVFDCSGAIFMGEVDFTNCSFAHGCDISGSRFVQQASFLGVHVDVADGSAANNNVNSYIVANGMDSDSLQNLTFSEIELKIFRFSCCRWPDRFGLDIFGKNSLEDLLKCQELYRGLKRLAVKENDQTQVGQWSFRERLTKLKTEIANSYKNNWIEVVESREVPWRARIWAWLKLAVHPPYRLKFSLLGLYWFSSGFGERYIRAGVWLAILALLPFIFSYSPIASGLSLLWAHVPGAQCVNVVIDYLSTSVNATTAMQYIPFTKDIGGGKDASGWLRVGQGLWQLLIAVQFTLFALAVRNHFRR